MIQYERRNNMIADLTKVIGTAIAKGGRAAASRSRDTLEAMKPLKYRKSARDRYYCPICDALYRGRRFSHFETHHILSRSQAKKLGLTEEQLNDTRNRIKLCFKCHQLTYKKRGRSNDPHFLEKLTKLEQAKRQIGFYIWFDEVYMSLSRDRRERLYPPELYGIEPLPRIKHIGELEHHIERLDIAELQQEIERLDREFVVAITASEN